MTDKVQKIRKEVERLREQLQNKVEESDFISGEVFIINYFLTFIDSLQEKPNAKFKVGQTITDPTDSTFTFHINKIEDGRYIEKEDEWVLVKEADANYELVEEPVSIDFEQELYKAFGQVKDFTLGIQIAKWFYDMGKNSQEPVGEELNEAAIDYAESVDYRGFSNAPWNFVQDVFKAGANWQKKQFEKDCADLCNGIVTAKGIAVAMAYDNGVANAKKQMMANAIDVTVHIDAGGYPYTPEIELYDYDKDVPLAKEGDKYKVVLIKED